MRIFTCLFVLALAVQAALALTTLQRLKLKLGDVPEDAQSLSSDPSLMSADSLGSSADAAAAVANPLSGASESSALAAAPAPVLQSQETIPATQLEGSLDGSVAAESSALAPVASESVVSESSVSDTCNQPAPCTGNTIVWGKGSSEVVDDVPSISVEEAVKPIDQWMRDFKSRSGDSGDLLSAAQTTVKPLIDKLKRNQEAAIEKLQQSNDAIRQHVEEATTEHIYNLLRAEKVKDEKETDAEDKKEKAEDVKEQLAEKEEQQKLIQEAAKEAVKEAKAAEQEASSLESKQLAESSSSESEQESESESGSESN